jgi:outer membrane receptor protein involved in Fe transport
MRIAILTVLIGVFQANISAQTLHGRITDAVKNEPIIGAVIQISNTSLGTVSDENGNYTLKAQGGMCYISVKFLGYAEYKDMVYFEKTETRTRDFKIESSAINKDVVVVTGGKYTKKFEEEIVSMEVLKANVVQNNNGRINEALNKIPGFNFVGESPSIRGGSGYTQGSASRLMVMLDDMPILAPENASVKWEMLPTDNLEQIELIKGASSCLYGSSALSGVMNVRTASPKTVPQTTAGFSYGYYDAPSNPNNGKFWKVKNTNGDEVVKHPSFININFADLRRIGIVDISEGLNIRTDESYLQYDEKTRVRNNFKIKIKPKNLSRWTFSINNNFLFEQGNYYFLWPVFPDFEKTDLYRTLDKNYTKSIYFNIDPIVTFMDKKDNMHMLKNRYMYGLYVASGQESFTHNSFHEYVYNTKVRKLKMNIIAGAMFSQVRTDGLAIQNKSAYNASAYIQADKKFFDKLNISAGLRLEYFKVDSLETAYEIPFLHDTLPIRPVAKIGFNYQINKGMFLRGSWGQGYRFPTLSELYYQAVSYGFPVYPNPTLRPEHGWNGEVGIKVASKVANFVGYFDVAAFYTRFYDMTDFQIGLGAGPKGQYGSKTINVDNAAVYGLEFSSLASGKIKKVELNYLVGLTYLEPRNLDYTPDSFVQNPDRGDTQLMIPAVPQYLKYRNKVSFKADIELKYNKVMFGISAIYNSHQMEADRDAGRVEALKIAEYRRLHPNGYWLIDSRFGYQITKQLNLMLNFKNILNEEYTIRPAKIEAPRNFTVSVIAKF